MKTILTYLFRTDRTYVVSFEYLTRRFVKVFLLGQNGKRELILGTDFKFISSTEIQTTLAWPNGEPWETLEIRRVTSATDRLVDFNDGSILRANDLNVSQLQAIHIAEEARDSAADNLSVDRDGNYDARNRRIVNLAAGQDDRDAVNMEQIRDIRNTIGETWRALKPSPGPLQPATRDNGEPLQLGDTWMESTSGVSFVYGPSGWRAVNVDMTLLGGPDGAALIGVQFTKKSAPIRTLADYIAASEVNIWLHADRVTERPDPLNPDTWDWTPAFQYAADLGGSVFAPAGRYIISTVLMGKSLRINCEPGVVFYQKDGSIRKVNMWSQGTSMFEQMGPATTFEVTGTWTYDGNVANQEQVEPIGGFAKCFSSAQDTQTGASRMILSNGTFVRGSYGYVIVRGDDVRRRWRFDLILDNCRMFATLHGKGKGDPETPTALGYSPTYVMVMDYVRVHTNNFQCHFDKPVDARNYAPTGILGTFYGTDYQQSGECQIYMAGITYARGMGRGGPNWDGTWTNNGIGVFDVYGNGESFHVERVIAEDCHVMVMRAKASINEFRCDSFRLIRCRGGIQVSPSSTGPCRAIVAIRNGEAIDSTLPCVEVNGTSWEDSIPQATVEGIYSLNADNRNSLSRPASVLIYNAKQVTLSNVRVMSPQVGAGIEINDCEQIRVENSTAQNVPTIGLLTRGQNRSISIDGFTARNVAGGAGVNVQSTGGRLRLVNIETSNTKDYSILINTDQRQVELIGSYAEQISGLSRAFYAKSGFDRLEGCKVGANVSTPVLSATGARNVIISCAWLPFIGWGGSSAPAVGTYNKGDILLNAFPATGNPRGFRCITGGTPGVWEQF
ncbi:tailspike / endo-glycosidase [Pseudomonas phage Stalingrad]|uniref:Probable tail spike protein n=1 Tax=Pseudomonas phage Stalingrad TaxID=2762287 RepID=A0A7G8LJ42_9CAUD|nr:tailspike / endo-glycosidase [Pseudomonas phage Stalingrad]